jgi:hypothetical protein
MQDICGSSAVQITERRLAVVSWTERDGLPRQREFNRRSAAEVFAAQVECRLGLDELDDELTRRGGADSI